MSVANPLSTGSGANSAADERLRSRIEAIQSLPALPVVLLQLMECLELPANEIDVDRVIELVSCDESVAAQCVRMTNSAMFGRRNSVESVREAVIAVGLWRITDMVFSCSIPRVFASVSDAVDPIVFWRHSLACALLSQRLAKTAKSAFVEKAYLAGLLHDIGMLVNATVFPKEFQAALDLASSAGLPIHEAEREVLGFTHAESGRMIAESWHFSPDLAAVIEFHHDFSAAPVAKELVASIHLSDLLCRHRGLGYGFYEDRLSDFLGSPAWLVLVRARDRPDSADVTRLANDLRSYADEAIPIVNHVLGQFTFGSAPRNHRPSAGNGKSPVRPTARVDEPAPKNGHSLHPAEPTAAQPADLASRPPVEPAPAPQAASSGSAPALRSSVEYFHYGFLRIDPSGKIVQANPAILSMLGYSSEAGIVGRNVGSLCANPADAAQVLDQLRSRDNGKGLEIEWQRRDGTRIAVRIAGQTVEDTPGRVACHEAVVEDITDRRALEQQLRQSQKMEAIGRLAGGIAHDFNNLLGVITGYSELILERLDGAHPLRKHTEEIRKASDRAALLTHQLLAFSRQQVLEKKVLNLNMIVLEMADMLQRLLGEDIELKIALDPSLGHVKADRGQLEQVIMNLAVNARDAMPGGGKLTIQSGDMQADREFANRHAPMTAGQYASLVIADTGMGMDAHTKAHLFEPFFTTKGPGKGTGLGLATVYGVIKQTGGYIWVDSEPGAGATFRIYLPRFDERASSGHAAETHVEISRGTETILLVEDEESLRTIACKFLEAGGYRVLVAGNGAQALEVAQRHDGPIHLLLTDVVMPGMNGRVVAKNILAVRPQTRVIYMSGYTGFSDHVGSDPDEIQLPKPFTRATLLRKVRAALSPESSGS